MNIDENKLPDNSYICIQAFMINDLNLSGNELLVYGLINGFCKKGKSNFNGSLSYIKKWINCGSKQTVINILNNLINRKLIIKKETTNNPNSCNQYMTNYDISKKETCPKNGQVQNLVVQKMDVSCPKSGQTTCLNYGDNNNIYNNNNKHNNTLSYNSTCSIPTLEEVLNFAKCYDGKLYIDPENFYWQHERNGWKDHEGKPIKNWKGLFNVWNKLKQEKVLKQEKEKQLKHQKQAQKIKKIKEKEAISRKQYADYSIKHTQLECPHCGCKLPDKNIRYDVVNKEMVCTKCNVRWKAIKANEDNNLTKNQESVNQITEKSTKHEIQNNTCNEDQNTESESLNSNDTHSLYVTNNKTALPNKINK